MGISILGPRRTLLLDTEPLQRVLKQIPPSVEGAVFDLRYAARRGQVWTDSAATIFARPGDPIGAMLDARGRYVATQATGAAKPILQTDGNRWWGLFDGTKFMSFALGSAFGDVLMVAGVRPASLSANMDVIGNRLTNDADGQSSLGLLSNGQARYVFRSAGANSSGSSSASVAVNSDAVISGRWAAALGGGVPGLNGAESALIAGAKIGSNTAVSVGSFTGGTLPFVGRLYSAAAVGVNPDAVQLRAWNQWGAGSAGMVF